MFVLSSSEVRKLPCFDVGFPEDCREKWTVLYEQYRTDMTHALDGKSKEMKDKAANAVYDKYKQVINSFAFVHCLFPVTIIILILITFLWFRNCMELQSWSRHKGLLTKSIRRLLPFITFPMTMLSA